MGYSPPPDLDSVVERVVKNSREAETDGQFVGAQPGRAGGDGKHAARQSPGFAQNPYARMMASGSSASSGASDGNEAVPGDGEQELRDLKPSAFGGAHSLINEVEKQPMMKDRFVHPDEDFVITEPRVFKLLTDLVHLTLAAEV